MADTSYRVWFGCRINGVEYERGELVTLDSANAGVQAALNHPGAPRIRVNDGGAGGVPDDGSVTDVKVATDAAIAVSKLAAGTLTSATTSMYVGRSGYTVSSYGAWDGYLCGLGWYETALSDARILAHAQAAGLA